MDSYGIHRSEELRRLFAQQDVPTQGQLIERASVVFVGLDANYSSSLLSYPDFFERIPEYHRDGVTFWKRRGVHHPFRLPEYPLPKTGGGLPYHRRFARTGLLPELAEAVVFAELLNVPTTGRTEQQVFWDLFDPGYAARLESVLMDGCRRLVILSNRTMRDATRRVGGFPWLPEATEYGVFHEVGETRFAKFRHFSSAINNADLRGMGDQIIEFCGAVRAPS